MGHFCIFGAKPLAKQILVHYCDVIIGAMASQITSLTIAYSSIHSGADGRKHQSSASLAFVRGIHRWPMNSLHKGPVTRKMFPFDDVSMIFDWTIGNKFHWSWIKTQQFSSKNTHLEISSTKCRSFRHGLVKYWLNAFIDAFWVPLADIQGSW